MKVTRLTGRAVWPHSDYLPDEDAILITGHHARPGQFALWGGVYLVGAVLLLMQLSGGPVSLFTLLSYIVFGIEGAWSPADNPRGWLCLALIVSLPLLYRPVWKPLIVSLFGGNVWVKVDAENVVVKSCGQTYSVAREDVREVAKERHHKALAESKRIGTYARQEKPVWQDAIEVVLRTGEVRLPIAEMVWQDDLKADALVLRVQEAVNKVDSLLDELAGTKRKRKAKPAAPEGEPEEYR